MDAIERLGNLTYANECDESRPLKHLVRLAAPFTRGLDMLPTAQTEDIFAYGETLDDAVDRALALLRVRTGRIRQAYATV
jgi:hypothetical protein